MLNDKGKLDCYVSCLLTLPSLYSMCNLFNYTFIYLFIGHDFLSIHYIKRLCALKFYY